jgi:hypothetical protein
MIVSELVIYVLIGLACLTTFCTAAIILLTVFNQVDLYIRDLLNSSPLRRDFMDEIYEDIEI